MTVCLQNFLLLIGCLSSAVLSFLDSDINTSTLILIQLSIKHLSIVSNQLRSNNPFVLNLNIVQNLKPFDGSQQVNNKIFSHKVCISQP